MGTIEFGCKIITSDRLCDNDIRHNSIQLSVQSLFGFSITAYNTLRYRMFCSSIRVETNGPSHAFL